MSSPAVQPSSRAGFPWMYTLRWIVGLAVTASGLYGLYWLTSSWAYLTDQAVIVPNMAPMHFLPAAVLKTVTGLAILLRTRFAIGLALAWTVAFVALMTNGADLSALPAQFWVGCLEQAAIVLFLVLLRSRRLLR